MGHSRQFCDVRDESDFTPTAAQWRTLRCFAFAPSPDLPPVGCSSPMSVDQLVVAVA
jgi:hypothetical protein